LARLAAPPSERRQAERASSSALEAASVGLRVLVEPGPAVLASVLPA
jgi:hypothetical protein